MLDHLPGEVKLMGLSTINSDVHVSIAVWDDWLLIIKLKI